MALINVYVQYPKLEKKFKAIKRQLRDIQESLVVLEEKVDALQPVPGGELPPEMDAIYERIVALKTGIQGIFTPK